MRPKDACKEFMRDPVVLEAVGKIADRRNLETFIALVEYAFTAGAKYGFDAAREPKS